MCCHFNVQIRFLLVKAGQCCARSVFSTKLSSFTIQPIHLMQLLTCKFMKILVLIAVPTCNFNCHTSASGKQEKGGAEATHTCIQWGWRQNWIWDTYMQYFSVFHERACDNKFIFKQTKRVASNSTIWGIRTAYYTGCDMDHGLISHKCCHGSTNKNRGFKFAWR